MQRLLKFLSILVISALLFSTINLVPIEAAAEIELSESEGTVGSRLRITGSGFEEDDSITITFDDEELDDDDFDDVDSAGEIDERIDIPSMPAGTYDVTVEDESGNSASDEFEIVPSISLSKTSGEPGTSLTVYGYGFQDYESGIKVKFNGADMNTTSKSANVKGEWNLTFTIPSLSSGEYEVDAYGSDTDDSDVDDLTFTLEVTPVITINKTSGPRDTPVTVSGTGFSSSESGIKVTFDGNQIGGTVSANATGTWSVTFNTPPLPAKQYTVDASGSKTAATSVADLSFTVTPVFSIEPVSGGPGTRVSVSGSGFPASSAVNLTFDNIARGTITTDENGTWSGSFDVPETTSGVHKVSAGSAAPAVNFTVGASIFIDKNSGNVGTTVKVTGKSFAANEQNMAITFDGETVKIDKQIQVSQTGDWTASFSVPFAPRGEHIIGARGRTTPVSDGTEATFIVVPAVSTTVSQISGKPGSTVPLSGTGFEPNEEIYFSIDGIRQDITTSADDFGTWTLAFPIPPLSAGSHSIKISGSVTGSVNSGNLNFKSETSMSLSSQSGFVGGKITITASGLAPNSVVKVMYDDIVLDTAGAKTDSEGNIVLPVEIPQSAGGNHKIRLFDAQNNQVEAPDFVMDKAVPPVPRAQFPPDRQTTGFVGGSEISFRWTAVEDPSGVSYNLQVSNDSEFISPVIEATDLSDTRYTAELGQGKYYWRVQAVDGATNTSKWSSYNTLQIGSMALGIFILLIIVGVAIIALGVFLIYRSVSRRKKFQAAGAEAPEIVIPEIINAEYRPIDEEAARKRSLPWRLALPQAAPAPKNTKTLSTEDQARLKVIIDFAQSLPLVEPGGNTAWLVELAENGSGNSATPDLFQQLLKGELEVRYEPAWMRHPTFLDLQTLLEGQPIIQDLNSFVEAVNHTATDAVQLLRNIYRDTTAEVDWDILQNGGWAYVSGVYNDSLSWYQGKNLKDPTDRDYSIKPEGNNGSTVFGLYGEQTTVFSGLLVFCAAESIASDMRSTHLKLRRTYRNNESASAVINTLAQLEVQRNRLLNAFSQFSKLNP